jgi:hypothetical protein
MGSVTEILSIDIFRKQYFSLEIVAMVYTPPAPVE